MTDGSPDKFAWERAMVASDLPSSARHVGHVLCMLADAKTAVVPAKFTPSLTALARLTRLDRTTVARHLKVLEAGGWVGRTRPDPAEARSKGERTRYKLTIPGSGTVPPPEQGMSDTGDLGSGVVPPGVVAQNPRGSGTVPPNQSGAKRRSIKKIERDLDLHRRKDPDRRIVATLLEVTGKTIPAAWVPKVRRAIFGGDGTPSPDIADPAAYAEKTIRNEPNPVTRFLPSPEPPRLKPPEPAQPGPVTPPPQPAPNGPADGDTAPPMSREETAALIAEARRRAREAREAKRRPVKPAPTPPDPDAKLTPDEEAHRQQALAALEAWAAQRGQPITPEGTT